MGLQSTSQAIVFPAFVTQAALARVKVVEHQSQLGFQLPLWWNFPGEVVTSALALLFCMQSSDSQPSWVCG